MNLILFTPEEINAPLVKTDPRAVHLLSRLNKKVCEPFKAGVENQSQGEAVITEIRPDSLILSYEADSGAARPLSPVSLILGSSRPPVMKRLLKDLTSLGLARILVTHSALSEKSYLQSRLWQTQEWLSALREGAMQGCHPFLPRVERFYSVLKAVESLEKGGTRLVMDVGPGLSLLADRKELTPPVALAVGPERGWTETESALFSEMGFEPVSLGKRILRTESAALIASGIVSARL